jgi:photosystem II stability/assembly factor-like uncharacterized protein
MPLFAESKDSSSAIPMNPGWAQQNPNTGRNLYAVEFLNATFGMTIGDRGGGPPATARMTSDGGATWTSPNTPPQNSLYGLDLFNASRAWAVGIGGVIAITNDSGANWVNQRNPGSFNDLLRDVKFYNATHGWAVGNVNQGGQTQVLVTTDGGANWAPQLQQNTRAMNALYFVDAMHGWTVGLSTGSGNGRLYNTSDGGATWTAQTPPGNQPAFYDVQFIDRWTGYVVGDNGVFMNTSDGGAIWTAKQIVNNVNFRSIYFVSSEQGWAVGANGNVWVTYDGGVSWTKQTSPINSNFEGVCFVDHTKGWAVGANGGVINTTDGGGLPTDIISPIVNITNPIDKSTVNQTVTISVNATDNVAVTKVSVAMDGVAKWNGTASPYNFSWDTLTVPDGTHVINATGFDAAGNKGYDQISVTVKNHGPDIVPPKVNITFPADNSKVSGNITIAVDATDNVAVANVSVRIDGNLLGVDPSAPYQFPWNTTLIADGIHKINATAIDTSNNTASHEILVLVLNTPDNPPTVNITSPKDGDAVAGNITVAANATDDKGVVYVEFFVDGKSIGTSSVSPYKVDWDTTKVKNGAHTLNATAHDTVGQTSSSTISVNVFNIIVPDKTPPQVAITDPADKATVSGSVGIKAIAIDNVAVSKVEFYIDGNLKATDSSAPYETTWDTTQATNGAHTILATAYDTSSNKASDSITVTVAQGKDAPPTLAILSPENGSTVAKSVTIAVDARDDIGIKYVSIAINGSEVANLTTAPFTYLWDTSKLSNGERTITAKVVDTISQSATASVKVKVDNAVTQPEETGSQTEGVPLWVAIALLFLVILLLLILILSRKKKGPEPEESLPTITLEKDSKAADEKKEGSESEKKEPESEDKKEPESEDEKGSATKDEGNVEKEQK